MVVVAKKNLFIDIGFSQNLVGLRTTRRPWQVAWFFNEHFSTQFCRIPDWFSGIALETGGVWTSGLADGTEPASGSGHISAAGREGGAGQADTAGLKSGATRTKGTKRISNSAIVIPKELGVPESTDTNSFTCYSWTSEQDMPLAYLLKTASQFGVVSPALRDACDYLLFYSNEAPLPEPGLLAAQVHQHKYFGYAMAIPSDDKRWSRQIPIFF